MSKLVLGLGLAFYLTIGPMVTSEITPVVLCGLSTAGVSLEIAINQLLSNAALEGFGERTDDWPYHAPSHCNSLPCSFSPVYTGIPNLPGVSSARAVMSKPKRRCKSSWGKQKDVSVKVAAMKASHLAHGEAKQPSIVECFRGTNVIRKSISTRGFPGGGTYIGTAEQKAKLRSSFERKVRFMRAANVPIYNGEFGHVYASSPQNGLMASGMNAHRLDLLKEQLSIYRETNVHWSIGTYKDINNQGMAYTDPASPYVKLLAPFIQKKHDLSADFGGSNEEKVKHVHQPLMTTVKEWVPKHLHNKKYLSLLWTIDRHFERVIREILLSEYLGWECAEYLEGLEEKDLDALAASSKIEICILRDGLNRALIEDAKIRKV